jgi:hypothetical protein
MKALYRNTQRLAQSPQRAVATHSPHTQGSPVDCIGAPGGCRRRKFLRESKRTLNRGTARSRSPSGSEDHGGVLPARPGRQVHQRNAVSCRRSDRPAGTRVASMRSAVRRLNELDVHKPTDIRASAMEEAILTSRAPCRVQGGFGEDRHRSARMDSAGSSVRKSTGHDVAPSQTASSSYSVPETNGPPGRSAPHGLESWARIPAGRLAFDERHCQPPDDEAGPTMCGTRAGPPVRASSQSGRRRLPAGRCPGPSGMAKNCPRLAASLDLPRCPKRNFGLRQVHPQFRAFAPR